MNPNASLPTCPAGMTCTMIPQDWIFLLASLILVAAPVLVLPLWAARKMWKISGLATRLVVMNGVLLTLGLILAATTQMKPTSITSPDAMTVSDFVRELLRLVGPFWIISLIVGVLFPYAT